MIYCEKCGNRHECSACPVCGGFGVAKAQELTTPTSELASILKKLVDNLEKMDQTLDRIEMLLRKK